MRIIRFLDSDGRTHHGRDRGDGTATRMTDPQGVLGLRSEHERRAMFRGRNTLIADDDANMRELMTTVLTNVGCACTVCADGEQALNVIGREMLDLVVSDIVMPHHNGYEIFAAARKQDEHMPVVLVTGFGYDPNHSIVRASEEGLAAVLYKPFTPQQLIDEIDRAIRTSTASPADALVPTGDRVRVARTLAPLDPVNVLCVGRNYPSRDHGAGRGGREHLELFMKPTTAVIGPGETIRLPDCGGADPLVDAEGELAVVIGAEARNVAEDDALGVVLGYTAAADVTARHWQTTSGPPLWIRGKGFDTFCPLGPVVVTTAELGNASGLGLRTIVNGTVVRQASTDEMLRPVATLVSELSRRVTLRPGTVILTGAPSLLKPEEHRPLRSGDEVVVEIEGIGRLVNRVEADVDER